MPTPTLAMNGQRTTLSHPAGLLASMHACMHACRMVSLRAIQHSRSSPARTRSVFHPFSLNRSLVIPLERPTQCCCWTDLMRRTPPTTYTPHAPTARSKCKRLPSIKPQDHISSLRFFRRHHVVIGVDIQVVCNMNTASPISIPAQYIDHPYCQVIAYVNPTSTGWGFGGSLRIATSFNSIDSCIEARQPDR